MAFGLVDWLDVDIHCRNIPYSGKKNLADELIHISNLYY
jgi:hypothetical protein